MPTESLFGFILRVSETNGYDTPLHVLNYAEYERRSMRSAVFLVNKLAKVLGRKVSELEVISYLVIEKNGSRSFKILNHNLGSILPYNFLRLSKPSFCPQCVQEHKIIDTFWDLYFAVACPQHRCQLLNTCPNCKMNLSWYRQGLLTCNCGTNFINTTLEPSCTSVLELMAILKAKLDGTSILSLPNTSHFPTQELEDQSLRSFNWLVARLGNYRLFSEGINTNKDPYQAVKAAADVLCDWPSGYHRFLDQLGMKLTGGGNPSSTGLRKQFEKFFIPMFINIQNTYVDSNFLRDEFIRFGLRSWGKAIVDNKLHKSTNVDSESRFFTHSQFACQLGISPVTLKKWAKKGLVPCEKVRVGNKVRYILDSEVIDLAKRAPGHIMNAREAASIARVPVSVLKALRKSGHFIVEHIPKHKSGFHEADLLNFSQKVLQKCALITEERLKDSPCISLDYILQQKQFWSNSGKANFFANYLDGIIQSIGRTGNSLEHIWFQKTDVDISVNLSHSKRFDNTISQKEAATIIGCGIAIIPMLLENKFLDGEFRLNKNRVTRASVKQFSLEYIPLSFLAEQLNTSAKRFLVLCRKTGIDVLCISRTNGIVAGFIKREDQEELIKKVQLNPTREQKREVARNKHIGSLAKLEHYFDSLRENGTTLPRCRLVPNKREIAAASGIVRNIFYYTPEAVAMLDKFDAEERQLKGIKKRDDLGDLQHYLEHLKKNKSMLPRHQNAQPNKVAIAKACGIDRSIFYTTPDAVAIIEKYAAEI